MTAPGALDELIERLERAAAQLRERDLTPQRAAALVDDCARLASEAGSRLDREVRSQDEGGSPGQLPLGG